MFSGRFELTPDADGAYFLDRDGTHFRTILNYMRNPVEKHKLSPDMTEGQKERYNAELDDILRTVQMVEIDQRHALQEGQVS